jgi:hypothetical protein
VAVCERGVQCGDGEPIEADEDGVLGAAEARHLFWQRKRHTLPWIGGVGLLRMGGVARRRADKCV